jgi:amidohydrolase
MMMSIQIKPEVKRCQEELVGIRRDIHQHPEVGFDVQRTAEFVAAYLQDLNLTVSPKIGQTGVVGDLHGSASGPTIALRADMDALPLTETSDIGYKSKIKGKMHACGHDGHTAILLVTAKLLTAVKDHLKGHIRFIFQPAEEKEGGARHMIADGCLEGVDEIYGLHLWNYQPLGWIGSLPGPVLAAADRFQITVEGAGGHGGMPHRSKDAIVIAAHLINALQTIISRNTDPLQNAVISVGTIRGGSEHNIIASTATLTGTIRTFTDSVRQLIRRRMSDIVDGLASAFNASIFFDFQEGYPATVNSLSAFQNVMAAARQIAGSNAKEMLPCMGGEDFSYYLQKVPGCFFFIGSSPEGASPGSIPHHSANFNFDEKALMIGTSMFLQTVENLLTD